MPLHGRLLACAMLGVVGMFPIQAHAELLGAGRTVQLFYYNGSVANLEGEIPVGGSSSDPASLAAAVDYQPGAVSGSTIHIGDNQIIITSLLSGAPFCFSYAVGAACTDEIDGFDFKFTGENILGVAVDPSSAPGFLPAIGTFSGGNTHLGLRLLGSNEIQLDVTGDLPNVNDQLVLDLTFDVAPPPSPVPEPAASLLLGSAVAGLGATRRRRNGRMRLCQGVAQMPQVKNP